MYPPLNLIRVACMCMGMLTYQWLYPPIKMTPSPLGTINYYTINSTARGKAL